MSHTRVPSPLPSTGRGEPRWSVEGQEALSPASMAELPACSAIVWLKPPLSARSASSGLLLRLPAPHTAPGMEPHPPWTMLWQMLVVDPFALQRTPQPAVPPPVRGLPQTITLTSAGCMVAVMLPSLDMAAPSPTEVLP